VLFPVKEIAEICQSRDVFYHCDAVQAAGKVDINLRNIPINYLSLTGHKFHAPKGIGALYVKRKTPISPFIHGGHQERSLRGGTECVPLMIGLGKAAELTRERLPAYDQKVRPLRDALEEGVLERIRNTELNGHRTQRLSNTTNISFHGIESEALLILLDKEGICASSGSACLADSNEPSHVIRAMKPDFGRPQQMLRFSLNSVNTTHEVQTTLASVKRAATSLCV
jgi:cysteine desulfurase